nr:HAD hydrolase-like protein [uncultured Flavobacterium sp.]
MKIFFDLDGTLLDSKPRLYHLFQFLVPESKLTFENYWNFKQDKISHRDLLIKHFNYNDETISKFTKEWMSLIEAPEWLSYDKLITGVKPFLDSLKDTNELYVVTARQSEQVARKQIEDLGLEGIFKDILVTLQKTEKKDLIRDRFKLKKNDWIIGDTGKDIDTGKSLKIKTAAVLSGFVSEYHLKTYFPDIIVENVTYLNF